MNHWKETAEVFARLVELTAAGRRAALATVVHIVGSAYRRPGARFLIEESGETLGGVSGGCLEADVREVARQQVLATGVPSLRHYSTAGRRPQGHDRRRAGSTCTGCRP
jgi:xanthine/CO dehydrogenase XdhC/CoxF family maturation factor